jgi:hypothetical protein
MRRRKTPFVYKEWASDKSPDDKLRIFDQKANSNPDGATRGSLKAEILAAVHFYDGKKKQLREQGAANNRRASQSSDAWHTWALQVREQHAHRSVPWVVVNKIMPSWPPVLGRLRSESTITSFLQRRQRK